MLTVVLGVLAISLVLPIAARWIRSALPRGHDGVSPDLLETWFGELLSSSIGSVLVINVRGTALTLQFRHQLRNGASGILFEYPGAEWSRPYFQEVQELAARRGNEIQLIPASPERNHEHMTVCLG